MPKPRSKRASTGRGRKLTGSAAARRESTRTRNPGTVVLGGADSEKLGAVAAGIGQLQATNFAIDGKLGNILTILENIEKLIKNKGMSSEEP
jgi:hypothetical protein